VAGYSDPQSTHNPTTGVAIPASWGDIVRDDIEWLAGGSSNPKPSCRVFNSADISIPNATNTAITFNSERWDNGAMHSTSSNTSRITIPSGGGGKYLFIARCTFAANATGTRGLFLRLNGSTLFGEDFETSASASAGTRLETQALYNVAAGDYVEAIAYQDSGGALNVLALGNYSPEFECMWLAV
jgi:hypothetical protein